MNDMQKSPTDKIKLPSVALLIVGILGLVSATYSILNILFGFGTAMWEPNDIPLEARQFVAWIGSIETVGVFVNVAGSSFLIWTALRMMKLRSHTAALVASAFCLIPCWNGACCCLGLPVGIWCLVTLLDADIKAGFDQ